MIYVTHDQVEAMTMADKIVVLRAGRVEQVGAPLDLYNHPANAFVAGFIGSPRMNFLSGTAKADAGRLGVEVPGVGLIATAAAADGVAPGAAISVGIRPEHVRAGPGSANTVRGEVASIEQLGGMSFIRLASPDLTAQLAGQTRLGFGDMAEMHLPAEALHVFDGEGLSVRRVWAQEAAGL